MQGSGFRVQSSGFRVKVSEFRVQIQGVSPFGVCGALSLNGVVLTWTGVRRNLAVWSANQGWKGRSAACENRVLDGPASVKRGSKGRN